MSTGSGILQADADVSMGSAGIYNLGLRLYTRRLKAPVKSYAGRLAHLQAKRDGRKKAAFDAERYQGAWFKRVLFARRAARGEFLVEEDSASPVLSMKRKGGQDICEDVPPLTKRRLFDWRGTLAVFCFAFWFPKPPSMTTQVAPMQSISQDIPDLLQYLKRKYKKIFKRGNFETHPKRVERHQASRVTRALKSRQELIAKILATRARKALPLQSTPQPWLHTHRWRDSYASECVSGSKRKRLPCGEYVDYCAPPHVKQRTVHPLDDVSDGEARFLPMPVVYAVAGGKLDTSSEQEFMEVDSISHYPIAAPATTATTVPSLPQARSAAVSTKTFMSSSSSSNVSPLYTQFHNTPRTPPQPTIPTTTDRGDLDLSFSTRCAITAASPSVDSQSIPKPIQVPNTDFDLSLSALCNSILSIQFSDPAATSTPPSTLPRRLVPVPSASEGDSSTDRDTTLLNVVTDAVECRLGDSDTCHDDLAAILSGLQLNHVPAKSEPEIVRAVSPDTERRIAEAFGELDELDTVCSLGDALREESTATTLVGPDSQDDDKSLSLAISDHAPRPSSLDTFHVDLLALIADIPVDDPSDDEGPGVGIPLMTLLTLGPDSDYDDLDDDYDCEPIDDNEDESEDEETARRDAFIIRQMVHIRKCLDEAERERDEEDARRREGRPPAPAKRGRGRGSAVFGSKAERDRSASPKAERRLAEASNEFDGVDLFGDPLDGGYEGDFDDDGDDDEEDEEDEEDVKPSSKRRSPGRLG
ncbi:hypothetical protein HYDPIDRAFT_32811 [Hydnomerulius pinastri MD-312]|uniref:Uncharacterized protein n=1 Tax=Hydnomerulius pinastri MD-312 TaxID=994086 RepID=A0A0C9V3D0_9AGAM|nr:hypothetical protein HYDPIDRAFT_32811 [Hydnomerulius pinastri MD-312]